jgi:hypothetical protein
VDGHYRMTEQITTPNAPALAPEQSAAQAQLDVIMADRSHPYHVPGHHRAEAAVAEVVALRRAILGEANRPVVEYREESDARPPVARPESAPISALYGREDFLAGFVGDVSPADRARAADAVEACGLTFFEGQQVLNATERPVPDAGDELNLAALWGEACDDNVRAVNRLLTQLRAVDGDLHDKLLPLRPATRECGQPRARHRRAAGEEA